MRLLSTTLFLLVSAQTALAHSERNPGLGGWFTHQFDSHLGTVIFILGIGFLVARSIYRDKFEPGFKKHRRTLKHRNDSGCGGSDSSSHSDGCSSGCGGGGD